MKTKTVLSLRPCTWYRIFHEKLAVPHFNNKFLAFHGTGRFSTALTTAHHSSRT